MPSHDDFVNTIAMPNAGNDVMQNYTQQFAYDALGNLQNMQSLSRWTRNYFYNSADNKLLGHTQNTTEYTYDAHGNILTMPHLTGMAWDFQNRLFSATNGTVTSYYNYDATSNRARKTVEKAGNIREERYYIGNYEVYRKFISETLDFERLSLHVSDGTKKFATIETKTFENGEQITNPIPIIRYQYDNHLGSACLELDENAAIISYEEYHPFGTTSYRSGRTETEVSLKRYKYVGKERDEETGLYYYGARYYAAWIARFVSVDPLQHKYPHYTPYQYAGNRPITYIDLDGLEPAKKDENLQNIILYGGLQNLSPELIKPVNSTVKPQNKTLELPITPIDNTYTETSSVNYCTKLFDATRLGLSYSSTTASAMQLAIAPLSNRWTTGTGNNLFLKTGDPTLDISRSKSLMTNNAYKLKDGLGRTGKYYRMTDDLTKSTEAVGKLSKSLNIASSLLEGINKGMEEKNPLVGIGYGLINYGINYNPAVSVIYNFGAVIRENKQFKTDMMNYYQQQMTVYEKTNSKKYDNAKENYNKYATELNLNSNFEYKQTFIGPSTK